MESVERGWIRVLGEQGVAFSKDRDPGQRDSATLASIRNEGREQDENMQLRTRGLLLLVRLPANCCSPNLLPP